MPADRSSLTKWCERKRIAIHTLFGNGGDYHAVLFSDLPEPERIAYLKQLLEDPNLPPGEYDENAHAAVLCTLLSALG